MPSLPHALGAPSSGPGAPLAARWRELCARCGLDPEEPLAVALSGGADSVYLLALAASASHRPLWALHVDHGLRGAESEADRQACVALCRAHGVPLVVARVELDPRAPDLEARARRARYAALASEARHLGVRCVATGHHADDALETLLLRWLRGTELLGLAGLEPRAPLPSPDAAGLDVVRPLLPLTRDAIRGELAGLGLGWREDSSNRDRRFTRNRVRGGLLPELARTLGPHALENLRAFGRAVGDLDRELDLRTAHLTWRRADGERGGSIARRALLGLPAPLRRRALWRLLTEAVGRAPARATLELALADLAAGQSRVHQLARGWTLELRARQLHLCAPAACPDPPAQQLAFDFAPEPAGDRRLGLPGRVQLPDGCEITAELTQPPPGSDVPRSGLEVELDAGALSGELRVRWPRPGDRFHGLGAPGSRPLARFLADAGVPRTERPRVPLVFAGDELVWVAGLRPGEAGRVRHRTQRRVRLRLFGRRASWMRERPGRGAGPAPDLFDALGR